MNSIASGVVYERGIPWLIRLLGCHWRDGRNSFRMTWGELSIGKGFGLSLDLFSNDGASGHFSLHVHVCRVKVYITLPFLERFAWHPAEIMESWGVSTFDGALHCKWGRHYKIIHAPWCDWQQVAHDVRRADGSWSPFVGSWEHDKEPDGRLVEHASYRYLLRAGDVQEVTAMFHVERRVRKLHWLRRLPWLSRTTYAIDVQFSGEIGEGTGSWKGGTVGCGYELRPDETPRECLKRMERDRKFDR